MNSIRRARIGAWFTARLCVCLIAAASVAWGDPVVSLPGGTLMGARFLHVSADEGPPVSYGTNLVGYLILRDVQHPFDPLVPGVTQTQRCQAMASFAFSTNGPAGFQKVDLPVCLRIKTETLHADPTQSVVSVELLELDATCRSNLAPYGVILRESPSVPSIGTSTVTRLPGGDFYVDSFFDIFTEVSLDGGSNWEPGSGAFRMEGRGDPLVGPKSVTSTKLVPPPGDELRLHPRTPVVFTNGCRLDELRIRVFTNNAPPPPWMSNRLDTLRGQAILRVSTNIGGPAAWYLTDAELVLRQRSLAGPAEVDRVDTEFVQMNLSGGTMPFDLVFRESPVFRSMGQSSLAELDDGDYQVDSFFDVFVEISTDAGLSWAPGVDPAHLELGSPAERVLFGPTPDFPSPNALLSAPADDMIRYGTNAAIRNLRGVAPSPATNLPAPGVSVSHAFTMNVILELSTDGGATFNTFNTIANCQALLEGLPPFGSTLFTGLRLILMNMDGHGLPPLVLIREMPLLESPGWNSSTPAGTEWQVDSFFDVWTELSLDNGSTWLPADKPMPIRITRNGDPVRIARGIDLHATPGNGSTYLDFGAMPLPPDFFGPGSDPFDGRVELLGVPLMPGSWVSADTVVQRPRDAFVPPGGGDVVPIEIVALNLFCAQNITVTYSNTAPELWYFQVCLSSSNPQQPGRLTIHRDLCGDGGSFESFLPVQPRITFTRVTDSVVRVVDPGPIFPFEGRGCWSATNRPALGMVTSAPNLFVDHDCNPFTPALGPLGGTTSNFLTSVYVNRCRTNTCLDAPLLRRRLTVLEAEGACHGFVPAWTGTVTDVDGDGVRDDADNCPTARNPDQADTDRDGVGDVCDDYPLDYDPCLDPFDYTVRRYTNAIGLMEIADGAVTTRHDLAGAVTLVTRVPGAGTAVDGDASGRDQVCTEMVALELVSLQDPSLAVRLDRGAHSGGINEERVNGTPGGLDAHPTPPGGMVDSFFDVFFEVELDGRRYHTPAPIPLAEDQGLKGVIPRDGELFRWRTPEFHPLFFNAELVSNLGFRMIYLVPEPLRLNITNGGGPVVTWPEPAPAHTLQWAIVLSGTQIWTDVAPLYVSNGTIFSHIVSPTNPVHLFRITRPTPPIGP